MKTTLGMLGALGVGICVGLLLAPEKGSESRERIANMIRDWREKLMDILQSSDEPEATAGDIRTKLRRAKSVAQEGATNLNEGLGDLGYD